MESFGVDSYFRLASDNSLVKNSNSVCWAGIDNVRSIQILASLPNYKALIDQRDAAGKPFKSSFIKPYLYIAGFEMDETRKYIKLLLDLIHKITYCKIVASKDKGKLIKFKFLDTYDQNLILLNFIRNLWYEPHPNYTKEFFKALEENPLGLTDSLERLTHANIVACDLIHIRLDYGHSNVIKENTGKIKNTKELLSYEGTSAKTFLTTK